MKKYIICIIIGIILLAALFIFLETLNKKNVEMKGIKSMRFTYTKGYMANAYVIYEIEYKDGKYISKIKPYGVSEEETITKEVDIKFISKMQEIFNKYEVYKWNGFNKNNKDVLDGDSFSFNLSTIDNGDITAHGYMSWPKNYSEVKSELDNLFESLLN